MDTNIFAARSLNMIEAAREMCLASRATLKFDRELIALSRDAIGRSRDRLSDRNGNPRHQRSSVRRGLQVSGSRQEFTWWIRQIVFEFR